jgi:hypothetical protein
VQEQNKNRDKLIKHTIRVGGVHFNFTQ